METPYYQAKRLLNFLPPAVRETSILAGGAMRSMLDGTSPQDIDLWFRTYRDFSEAAQALAVHPRFRLLSPGTTWRFKDDMDREWNLIGFNFGTPYEHLDRFDFRCCQMAAWYEMPYGTFRIHAEPLAIADAVAKNLYVRNNNGTARTLLRIAKYVEQYGYTLTGVNESEPQQGELFDEGPGIDLIDQALAPLGTATDIHTLTRRLGRCPRPVGGGYP